MTAIGAAGCTVFVSRRHEQGLSISGHTQSNSKTAKRVNHIRLFDTTR